MLINWERNNDHAGSVGTTGKRQIVHYMPNFIVAFNMLSVIMTSADTLLAVIHYDEASNATRPYILGMHIPFNVNTRSTHIFLVFLQLFYLLILSAGAATINSVLIILVNACNVIIYTK